MAGISPTKLSETVVRYLDDFNPWHNVRHFAQNVGNDILSGLTVAVIALPLALAFGVASGLGPETGMWAAICGGIFVGLFGGSKTGVSGPTGPKVVQLAAIVELTRLANGQADLGFIFSLVFLSGLVCVGLALLKVGRFIYYTPYSVVSGFMCGIGVIIVVLEIPAMLGFQTPSSVWEAIRQIPYDILHEDPRAVIVSGATFATIVLWPRISPVRWLPGPLIGLLVGTGIAAIFQFDIAYIGEMPTGLPKIYWPSFSRFDEMIGPATALAGLAIFDSLLTCLVADNMTDDRHNSDREIFGQGIANMMCGLVGGVTTATATMRTVANIKCGGRSGLAGLVHGVVLLALMLGLAPFASYIPIACLAGILLKIGIDIIDYRVLPVLHRMPFTDALCFWAVLLLTVSVDLLVAMGVGVAIAFVRVIHELGSLYEQDVVSVKQAKRQFPGDKVMPDELKERILKLRLEGPLFFGVSDTLYRVASSMNDYDYLMIRLHQVPMIDMSGAFLLDDIIDKAHANGAIVVITGLRPSTRRVLDKLKILDKIGHDRCFEKFNDAMVWIEQCEGIPVTDGEVNGGAVTDVVESGAS
ncbi:SulP family inorganic anion transporter [Kolteria novifilia]|uniref:SulP family inorganic anion transporter n=1 Tax=Kolteria novifilia TaxID=2527975 RepID=UPI003AF40B04